MYDDDDDSWNAGMRRIQEEQLEYNRRMLEEQRRSQRERKRKERDREFYANLSRSKYRDTSGDTDFLIKIAAVLVLIPLIYWQVMAFVAATVVTFHAPEEEDMAKDWYKLAAAEEATDFIKEIQKDNWEKHGLTVLTQEDRNWLIADLKNVFNGNAWSGYEGQKIARIINPWNLISFVDEDVSYEGNHIYQVKEKLPIQFFATSNDGRRWKKYACPEYEYVITMKCNPERNRNGLMEMNWEVLNTELSSVSADEEKIIALTESMPIPADFGEA